MITKVPFIHFLNAVLCIIGFYTINESNIHFIIIPLFILKNSFRSFN